MAEKIKHTQPLPKGRCQTCGEYTDRLVPITITVCKPCGQAFLNKAGGLRFVQAWKLREYYCDWCFGKTFSPMQINPFICSKCMQRLGHKHQIQLPKLKYRILKARKPWQM